MTSTNALRRGWWVALIATAVLTPQLDVTPGYGDRVWLAIASLAGFGLGLATRLGWVLDGAVTYVRWALPLYVLSWVIFLTPGESSLDAARLMVVVSFGIGLFLGEARRHRAGRLPSAVTDLVARLRDDLGDPEIVPYAGPASLARGDRRLVVHGGRAADRWWVECRARAGDGWIVLDERDVDYDELLATARVHLGDGAGKRGS